MRKHLWTSVWKYYKSHKSCVRVEFSLSGIIAFALALFVFPLDWVCGWLIAVIIHEFGHYLALFLMDVNIYEVRIMKGGVLLFTETMTNGQELIASFAGPIAGLMLLLFSRWLPRAAVCVFLQTVFNLLPIYPMDGGRIIRALYFLAVKKRNIKFPCKAMKQIVQ